MTTIDPSEPEEVVGRRFGRLHVPNYGNAVETEPRPPGVWSCHCLCGTFLDVHESDLLSGAIKSCGCIDRLVK